MENEKKPLEKKFLEKHFNKKEQLIIRYYESLRRSLWRAKIKKKRLKLKSN